MSVQFPPVPKGPCGHGKLTSVPYDSLKLRFRATPTPDKRDSPYSWVPLLRYVTSNSYSPAEYVYTRTFPPRIHLEKKPSPYGWVRNFKFLQLSPAEYVYTRTFSFT